MALKENDVKWFRPLWIRICLAVFLTAWLAWELFFTKDQFWALLVGAALAYSLYNFFYAFPKEDPADEQISPPRPPEGNDGSGS
ncbi:hypothetical protein [Devosia sp. 2618]|uniref:hypothetical protein n=1 Tax=Devosia sp. 2618 TaxID=3156454 RepID=UPI00339A21DC